MESTTDDVLLHVRADTCIPVVRLVGVVVWLMHIATKWPPLTGALARNIPCKETRRPSDKDTTHPAR